MDFVLSDSYPRPIKQLAADVIVGKEEKSALRAAVTAFDATQENKKEAEAKEQTEELGDTKGEMVKPVSQDGQIRSHDDFYAEINRMKAGG